MPAAAASRASCSTCSRPTTPPLPSPTRLARDEDPANNPAHYVRYAHARTASIEREAGEERTQEALRWSPGGPLELHPSERELVRKLLAFPGEVGEATARRAPHRIATYALELARTYSAFYRDCPVLKAETSDLQSFRLGLCVATRRTIARALDLLGVSAPESM